MNSRQERRIFNAQIKWIENRFGKDCTYNLGWSSSYELARTKVYGAGGGYLNSFIDNHRVCHDFEPFNPTKEKTMRKKSGSTCPRHQNAPTPYEQGVLDGKRQAIDDLRQKLTLERSAHENAIASAAERIAQIDVILNQL